jgi:glutathione peroxidase
MKTILLSLSVLLMSLVPNTTDSIYQFKVKDINGKTFDFASLKGKKIMIVNTASKCGLTPQYEQLEALYTKYKSRILSSLVFLPTTSCPKSLAQIKK